MNDTVQYGKRLPPVCLSLPIRPPSCHLFSFILPVRRRGSQAKAKQLRKTFHSPAEQLNMGFPSPWRTSLPTSTQFFLQVDRSGLVGLV
jgi:hypothetical protein